MRFRVGFNITLFLLGNLALLGQTNLPEAAGRWGSHTRNPHAVMVKPEARKDYRFASGRSALRIPFEEDDGHIFLQARINNSAPLWFGLDTGAIRSSIDTRQAQTLGLRFDGTQRVGGA